MLPVAASAVAHAVVRVFRRRPAVDRLCVSSDRKRSSTPTTCCIIPSDDCCECCVSYKYLLHPSIILLVRVVMTVRIILRCIWKAAKNCWSRKVSTLVPKCEENLCTDFVHTSAPMSKVCDSIVFRAHVSCQLCMVERSLHPSTEAMPTPFKAFEWKILSSKGSRFRRSCKTPTVL